MKMAVSISLQIRADQGSEFHQVQDLGLDINSGAISVRVSPSGRSSNTARSVT